MDTTALDLVIWLVAFLGTIAAFGWILIRGLHLEGADLDAHLDPHTTSY